MIVNIRIQGDIYMNISRCCGRSVGDVGDRGRFR